MSHQVLNVISFCVYTDPQSTSPLVDCFINQRLFTFSQLIASSVYHSVDR